MILISHRGNLKNSEPNNENNPEYIQKALDNDYYVMVDLRIKNNKLYLGENEPIYLLDLDWFEKYHTKLWLRCREIEVIEKLNLLDNRGLYLNYFWFENDILTITSKGYLLINNGKEIVKNGIMYLPEMNNNNNNNNNNISQSLGICSNIIEDYKLNLNKND
jgi:hypothetical protein